MSSILIVVSDHLSHSHQASSHLLDSLNAALPMLLSENPEGISEFELIRTLSQPPFSLFRKGCLSDSLSLFRVHFVLFHVLYSLRDQYHATARGTLEISAMRIRQLPYAAGIPGLAFSDPLREYYLDWQNFEQTGQEDVDSLLESFWKGFATGRTLNTADLEKACATLELTPAADYAEIKRQYRKLAMKHHPDRGGNSEKLKEINGAMLILSKHYRV